MSPLYYILCICQSFYLSRTILQGFCASTANLEECPCCVVNAPKLFQLAWTLGPAPWILDPAPWTLGPGPTRDPGPGPGDLDPGTRTQGPGPRDPGPVGYKYN